MEEKKFRNRKIKRAVIGASAISLVTLGTVQPGLAIGISLGAMWAIPGVVMSKELSNYEKEKNKSLTLNYNNSFKRED